VIGFRRVSGRCLVLCNRNVYLRLLLGRLAFVLAHVLRRGFSLASGCKNCGVVFSEYLDMF
jgi:hypothetical protein